MTQRSYQICANCVVDTSDTKIAFESRGVCDHYNTFIMDIKSNWHTDELGLNVIQKMGVGQYFDCIIVISGDLCKSNTAPKHELIAVNNCDYLPLKQEI